MYQHRAHRATDFGMTGKDLPADGVVTGVGAVGGRVLYVASQTSWSRAARWERPTATRSSK